MGRARDLTMGDTRRRRAAATSGYAADLRRFTKAADPDVEAFGRLLHTVAHSPRALTLKEGRALTEARARYARLTGDPGAGPADTWTPLHPDGRRTP